MRLLALLALSLLLVAPPAAAHASDLTGVFGVEADGLGVFLQADTLVLKAQREVVFNGTVLSNASGPYEPVHEPAVEIELTGPGTTSMLLAPRQGGFQATVTFPAPGEWDALVHVEDKLRRIPLHVYPLTNVWLESSNLRSDYHYVEMPVNANLYFLDDATGIVADARQPAEGRLSRIVDGAHVGTSDVVLPPGPMGSVVFAHTFAEKGDYVLEVSSAQHGIPYGGLPEIAFRVQDRFAGAPLAKTPGLELFALLGVAAVLALVRRK